MFGEPGNLVWQPAFLQQITTGGTDEDRGYQDPDLNQNNFKPKTVATIVCMVIIFSHHLKNH